MPTSHPRHSITETPDLAAVLKPLRARLGDGMPSLGELVRRGALAELRELEARDRGREEALATFVERMRTQSDVDLDEVDAIRRSSRRP